MCMEITWENKIAGAYFFIKTIQEGIKEGRIDPNDRNLPFLEPPSDIPPSTEKTFPTRLLTWPKRRKTV